MDEKLRNMVNAIWDREAARAPNDHMVMPDAIVARELGISKWDAIAAREGYVAPRIRKPSHVRRVKAGNTYNGFCSTAMNYVNVTLPRVSILEAAA